MLTEEKYQICVEGLKAFGKQAGFSQFLIGLSGGIDSALTATMCVDAFGADHVHGVMLPGPYSSTHSVEDAQELAENLGISVKTISIVKPFEAFKDAFEEGGAGALESFAAENTQARCRMICLMALSNAHNWMLVNTGNKSEALVGYATLHGDMAGAYAPLGGLYKTEVYELARWRNAQDEAQGARPSIPLHILEKAPSAELSSGQEDEKCLGISYAELDKILIALVEEGKSIEELYGAGQTQEQVQPVITRMEANAFKLSYEPPFPEGILH